ncbi:MAG: hypothetical protein KBE23_10280 [Chloroflexi bacterium]|nr:hypothetical protein [Chloroflexota bacterium]MBP7043120.1 hypothetical protein [Chloroflexota bacterium]
MKHALHDWPLLGVAPPAMWLALVWLAGKRTPQRNLGSLLWRALSALDSLSCKLADVACLSHGFILTGAQLPLPMVDGGVILPWMLGEQGYTPKAADAVVQKAGVLALALLSSVITWLLLWSRREAIGRLWAANGRLAHDPI